MLSPLAGLWTRITTNLVERSSCARLLEEVRGDGGAGLVKNILHLWCSILPRKTYLSICATSYNSVNRCGFCVVYVLIREC